MLLLLWNPAILNNLGNRKLREVLQFKVCKFPLKLSKENRAFRVTFLEIIKFNIAGFNSTLSGLVSENFLLIVVALSVVICTLLLLYKISLTRNDNNYCLVS